MWISLLIGSVIVVSGGFGAKYLIDVKKYKDSVNNIQIKNLAINQKANGEYVGEYDVNFISAKVSVKIEDKKIKSITLLEHKNHRGKVAEKIIDEVKAKNSIKVDTISGATNSSKVILKAIEKALEG